MVSRCHRENEPHDDLPSCLGGKVASAVDDAVVRSNPSVVLSRRDDDDDDLNVKCVDRRVFRVRDVVRRVGRGRNVHERLVEGCSFCVVAAAKVEDVLKAWKVGRIVLALSLPSSPRPCWRCRCPLPALNSESKSPLASSSSSDWPLVPSLTGRSCGCCVVGCNVVSTGGARAVLARAGPWVPARARKYASMSKMRRKIKSSEAMSK